MSFMAEMDKRCSLSLNLTDMFLHIYLDNRCFWVWQAGLILTKMFLHTYLENICFWIWQAGLRCEETIKAFLSVATVNIVANQSHPIDQKLPELLIKLKYLGFPLKNSMFKVDTATVGSLLDNTNASNWRDALLQVLT